MHETVPAPEDADRARFDAERDTAWATRSVVDRPSPAAATTTTPAYFDVAVRPGPYDPERLNPAELGPFIEEQAVRLRGWPVPMVSPRDPLQRSGTSLAQDSQSQFHVEAWRVFTSGQFLHRRALATDVRDTADQRAEHPQATGAVAVWDVLLYIVEVAELGARLASRLGCDTIGFDVSVRGIMGRELVSGERGRYLNGTYLSRQTCSHRRGQPTLLTCSRTLGASASPWRSASSASSDSPSRTRCFTTTTTRSCRAPKPLPVKRLAS